VRIYCRCLALALPPIVKRCAVGMQLIQHGVGEGLAAAVTQNGHHPKPVAASCCTLQERGEWGLAIPTSPCSYGTCFAFKRWPVLSGKIAATELLLRPALLLYCYWCYLLHSAGKSGLGSSTLALLGR
jgi:hypothetical protein